MDSDALKIAAVATARWINHAAIQRWSALSFRRRRPPLPRFEVASARDVYGLDHLPDGLLVPRSMPAAAKLPWRYTLPYYYLTGAVFQVLAEHPIDRTRPWTNHLRRNRLFPANAEGWTSPNDDASTAALRICGGQPWLLRRLANGRYEADYSTLFDGIGPSVAVQMNQDASGPTIRVDSVTSAPGDPTWCEAKHLANALDIRAAVFGKHLLETHLVVGQAFALSVTDLPPSHPLRDFLETFTYGTLHVNHFAYKLLLGPSSYFHTSRFTVPEQTCQLFTNGLAQFDLDHWRPARDAEARGLHHIEDHPLVVDAIPAWEIFLDFATRWLHETVPIDDVVRRWQSALLARLPRVPADLHEPDAVPELLAICLYNNVVHELAGDFSSYAGGGDIDDKRVVDLAAVLEDPHHIPRAADAFLFDQGAFASAFNNRGNNILGATLRQWPEHAILRDHIGRLQSRLREHEADVRARNARRTRPMLRMLPSYWEASISF